MNHSGNEKYHRAIKIWLFTGVILVFIQIVIGGVTRLTGSGLSITKWEIVTGTLPPLNSTQWEQAFDLYKATPQYQKINQGMSMSEFKFIYFWEYFHRLWARAMGLVFVIPFVIFMIRGDFDRKILRLLGIIILLAAVVATFGWIMVASGLNDRPWVNAYKLTLHLNLGLAVFGAVWWTYLYARNPSKRAVVVPAGMRTWLRVLFTVFILQLILGGIMSGMKAGIYYPTWPDMNGDLIPKSVLSISQYTSESFVKYDLYPLAPALVQVLHRFVAYALVIAVSVFTFRFLRDAISPSLRTGIFLLLITIFGQVLLGILTVIHCIGGIPVALGVFHQIGAIFILAVFIYLLYVTRRG